MKSNGNVKSNAHFNPDETRHPPPTNMIDSERDSELEKYIRCELQSSPLVSRLSHPNPSQTNMSIRSSSRARRKSLRFSGPLDQYLVGSHPPHRHGRRQRPLHRLRPRPVPHLSPRCPHPRQQALQAQQTPCAHPHKSAPSRNQSLLPHLQPPLANFRLKYKHGRRHNRLSSNYQIRSGMTSHSSKPQLQTRPSRSNLLLQCQQQPNLSTSLPCRKRTSPPRTSSLACPSARSIPSRRTLPNNRRECTPNEV